MKQEDDKNKLLPNMMPLLQVGGIMMASLGLGFFVVLKIQQAWGGGIPMAIGVLLLFMCVGFYVLYRQLMKVV